MKEAMLVHISEALERLPHYALDLHLWEVDSSVLHELVDILLHVLEDKVEVVVHSDYLLQLHDVLLIELPQRFDLSQGHAFFPGVKFLLHLFDCDFFVALLVGCLHHRAVGTIANVFDNFISIHYSC